MTPQEQNALAARSRVIYAGMKGSGLTFAYISGGVIYPWEGLSLTVQQLPFAYPSGFGIMELDGTSGLRVKPIEPPIYYLMQADGTAELGYFDPKMGIFFHWRNSTQTPAQAILLAHAGSGATELAVHRVSKRVEIAAPFKVGG